MFIGKKDPKGTPFGKALNGARPLFRLSGYQCVSFFFHSIWPYILFKIAAQRVLEMR
jgi:hypothetical protein